MFVRHQQYRRDTPVLARLNQAKLHGRPYPEGYDADIHARLSAEHKAYVNSWQYHAIVNAQILWKNVRYSRPVVFTLRAVNRG